MKIRYVNSSYLEHPQHYFWYVENRGTKLNQNRKTKKSKQKKPKGTEIMVKLSSNANLKIQKYQKRLTV